MSDTNSSLRDALYAPPDVWVEEIDALLAHLDPDILDANWDVNDAVYVKGSLWGATSRDGYRKSGRNAYPSVRVQFVYDSGVDMGTWIRHTRHFWVDFTHRVTAEYAPTDEGTGQTRLAEPQYAVGGILSDTLVTPSLDEVVSHVTTQFEHLPNRVWFNLELERLSPTGGLTGPRSLDKVLEYRRFSSPVSLVKGIGKTTTERLVNHFGAYSNILLYDAKYLTQHLSYAYGNAPDSRAIVENIETAVDRYRTLHEQGETHSTLLPEDVTQYPMVPPVEFVDMDSSPHTRY